MPVTTLSFILIVTTLTQVSSTSELFSACCRFPCQNQGICVSGIDDGKTYTCDCTGTGYTGTNCERPTWATWFTNIIKPSPDTIHHISTDWKFKPLIWIINNIDIISDSVIGSLYVRRANFIDSYGRYDSDHDYINFEVAINRSLHGRILPPVPRNCPTPLGVAGSKNLPPIESVIAFFKRKTFKPNPLKTNALFLFYAQFFTHQFFRIDRKDGPKYTKALVHGVDFSQLYGNDQVTQKTLRTMIDGKMKVQILNGEEWPPTLKDANVHMHNPKNLTKDKLFALGHPFFSLMPGLFMYSTIWLREHNRVASILKGLHPAWDDERLFETTRMILLGEIIKISVENYVQHLSNYNVKMKYKPELVFNRPFQYQNRISVEFNFMYRWHALVPDNFIISGVNYTLESLIGNSEIAVKHGMNAFVAGMIQTRAGQITHGNHHNVVLPVIAEIIKNGRELRFQSFNNYRRRYNLRPFKSFEDMVGENEVELIKSLKNLYGDIEAMEFVPGLYLEKRVPKGMFGQLIVELGAPAAITGMLANVINSPKYWKPSTFGGDTGFAIIKTASLQKLFCENMKNETPCPDISFSVPNHVSDAPGKGEL